MSLDSLSNAQGALLVRAGVWLLFAVVRICTVGPGAQSADAATFAEEMVDAFAKKFTP